MCIRDSSWRSLPSSLSERQTRTEPEVHLALERGVHRGRGRGARERQAPPDTDLEANLSTCQPGQTPHGERETNLAGFEDGRTRTPRTRRTDSTGQPRAPTAPRRTESAPEAKATQGPDQTQEPTST